MSCKYYSHTPSHNGIYFIYIQKNNNTHNISKVVKAFYDQIVFFCLCKSYTNVNLQTNELLITT